MAGTQLGVGAEQHLAGQAHALGEHAVTLFDLASDRFALLFGRLGDRVSELGEGWVLR